MRRPAVFLDRDGVLNRAYVRGGKPHPPASAEALEILPHVAEGLRALRVRGFPRVVVTNQPDVARGVTTLGEVERIHERLLRELELDAVYACFHDTAAGCGCRKPRPGLLLRAAADLGLDLSASYLIGDRRSDIEAGRSAGCCTLFVDCGYRESPPRGYREPAPLDYDYRVASLLEASQIIVDRAPPS
jgi:D-glycero-D-manno-heptose 1,7-bisphosphate phosphatase